MIDPIQSAIAGALIAIVQIWGQHNGKPKDWRPTIQYVSDILLDVDESTPENMKAAARQRLGIPDAERL